MSYVQPLIVVLTSYVQSRIAVNHGSHPLRARAIACIGQVSERLITEVHCALKGTDNDSADSVRRRSISAILLLCAELRPNFPYLAQSVVQGIWDTPIHQVLALPSRTTDIVGLPNQTAGHVAACTTHVEYQHKPPLHNSTTKRSCSNACGTGSFTSHAIASPHPLS